MNREEQIIKTSDIKTYQSPPQFCELVRKAPKTMCAYQIGFIEGAVWADENPSEEVLKRVTVLYKDWLVKQDIDNTPIEYIKKHWNDKNIH